mmetsp:Transcript_35066/g.109588  ORF Transcript_35066/g.109588 Transcript_35066/m.109588 type:complete len:93 (+) Transcript_35066:605-883(+)
MESPYPLCTSCEAHMRTVRALPVLLLAGESLPLTMNNHRHKHASSACSPSVQILSTHHVCFESMSLEKAHAKIMLDKRILKLRGRNDFLFSL